MSRAEKTKVHFTWIGPRSQNGHDVTAALKMCDHIDAAKTQLYFWCLLEHADVYREIFAGKPIIVRPVQSYLEQHSANENANAVQMLFQRLLYATGRGDVRDRVTLKEAMVFLLLVLERGYALDTNVMPTTNDLIHFPPYNTFHMLGIHYPVVKCRDADVGVMYSPSDNPTNALNALRLFLREIDRIEAMRDTMTTEEYKMAVLDVVIEAAFHEREQCDFWFPRHLGGNFPVYFHLEDPKGIVKYYANSHGATDRKVIPALHLAASKDDTNEVRRLLDAGIDMNEVTSTEKYLQITALSVATFYHHHEVARLLISRGADSTISLIPAQFALNLFAQRATPQLRAQLPASVSLKF